MSVLPNSHQAHSHYQLKQAVIIIKFFFKQKPCFFRTLTMPSSVNTNNNNHNKNFRKRRAECIYDSDTSEDGDDNFNLSQFPQPRKKRKLSKNANHIIKKRKLSKKENYQKTQNNNNLLKQSKVSTAKKRQKEPKKKENSLELVKECMKGYNLERNQDVFIDFTEIQSLLDHAVRKINCTRSELLKTMRMSQESIELIQRTPQYQYLEDYQRPMVKEHILRIHNFVLIFSMIESNTIEPPQVTRAK